MKVPSQLQGKWISQSNIGPTPHCVRIAGAWSDTTYGRTDICLSFEDDDRCLRLNGQGVRALCEAYGDETDDWLGRSVEIKIGVSNFQGRSVPGLHLTPLDPPIEPWDADVAPAAQPKPQQPPRGRRVR